MDEFILQNECTLMQYTQEVKLQCVPFSCGDQDLDDFFRNDVFLYEEEMLGKTYCWVTNSKPHNIVCLITIANDSIKSSGLPKNSKNRLNRIFNNDKRNLTYPVTLAFYEHNGFVYMHKTEDVERVALRRYDEDGKLISDVPDTEPLHTRMMYFDLKRL